MQNYPALLNKVEDFIAQQRFEDGPPELYEPVQYMMSLGGKRMRPVSLLMACEMFGGNVDEAVPLAYAVELFHNFTLVHDDIMDKAKMRRGEVTVHEKYDLNTGILSGDAMFMYVYLYLEHLPADQFKQAVLLLNDTSVKVCEGQQYDLNFETQQSVSEAEYFKMIEYKTAVLLSCALQLGALVSGANKADQKSIYDFGLHVGLAFQLMDDWLDTFGDETQFGKSIGGDILQGKKTYLLIKAKELADAKDKAFLNNYLTSDEYTNEEKVAQVTGIFKKLKVDESARQMMDKHHQKAIDIMESIDLPLVQKQPLIDMADQLLKRTV